MALSAQDLAAFHATSLPQQAMAQSNPKSKGPGNFLTHLLPSIGGIGGGVAGGAAGGALAGTAILPGIGTVAGGLLGALLGGAGGGAIGKVGENALEHQNLGSGVAKEAAINGILSAGPGRLVKGGWSAGKVLAGIGDNAAAAETAAQGGSRLMQALNAGGVASASPSIFKTAVANKLDNAAGTAAQKGLKINDTAFLSNFNKSAGEPVGEFARRFGVPHNGLESAVPNTLVPGFHAYGTAIDQIGTIPKSEILNNIKSQVAGKLASPVPDIKAAGQAVIDKANSVLENLPENVPAVKLNAIKSDLSGLVKKGVSDGPTLTHNEVLQSVGDGFRHSINQAADKAGVTIDKETLGKLGYKANNVGELGNELNNLKTLLDKAEVKSWQGSGTNPISLSGSAALGGFGGPGGLMTALGIQAINSSTGKKLTAKGIDAVASRLDKAAVKSAGNPYTAVNVAKRVAPAGLLGALGGDTQSNSAQMTTDPSMNSAPNSIDPLSQNTDQNASATPDQTQDPSSPFNPANIEANVQQILASGGKMSDATAYLSLVKTMQDLTSTPAQKGMNSTAAGVVSDTQQGIQTLGNLSGAISNSNANNPLIGKLRGLNPLDTNAQSLQSQINAARQIIGKAMEGGVLRKEDEAKYAKILPTMNDTDAVAQAKIQYIQQQLATKLGLYQQNIGVGGGGTDTSSLLSALGAQ